MDISDFDQGLLPDPGLPVDLGIEGVADTVAQAKSYFSIRLSGGMLDSHTMSFHQFKKMIDNAYSAVRSLLAPNEFRDSKSQVFDFRITEPQFGSLIINIDRPDLPSLDASKRILNDEGVSNQAVGQYFNNTRELTLRRLDQLQKTVQEADVRDQDLVTHLSLIRDLSRLFPDKNDLHEDIELSGEVNGERKVFVFNAANTKKLSEAYSRLMEMPRDASGEISIINNGSFAVVINPDNMKPLTCKFSKEDFLFMTQSPSFKTGAVLSVHGVIQERKQRHLMYCDRPGLLPDAPQ
jgi:hypothetical protein